MDQELEQIISFDKFSSNRFEAACSYYEYTDKLFNEGQFKIVDDGLLDLMESIISGSLALTVLTATLPARKELKNRVIFYEYVKDNYFQNLSDKEKEKIFIGFK